MNRGKRKPRGSKPPPRLAWGGGEIGKTASLKKSKEKPLIARRNHRRMGQQSAVLWTEKHRPRNTQDLCVAPKKVGEFRETLLLDGGGGLCVLVGSPGIGKSTMVHLVAKDVGMEIKEWTEEPHSGTYLHGVDMEQASPLNDFEDFLKRSSFNLTGGTKSVVLIDELPNLHGEHLQQRFRAMMTLHVQTSTNPTVLIFSQTREGKHQPSDLERLIDPTLLYHSDRVRIMQIHAVTKPKLRKICTAVCKAEKVKPPQDWDEFHATTQGDVRHALMSLQFSSATQPRDQSLTSFHALGKLLYAKRRNNSTPHGRRGTLSFDPEQTAETSGMDDEAVLTFLQGNGLDFFSKVSQWSAACQGFSDAAAMMLTPQGRGRPDSGGYASSITSRTVAATNLHPAHSKFRSLTAPKIYQVKRKARDNRHQWDLLRRRLTAQGRLDIRANIGGTSFVTQTVPFLRSIVPEEVNAAMNNMYSVVTHSTPAEIREGKSEEELRLEQQAIEQKEILALDDIEDFVSDDDDEDAPIKVTQSESEDHGKDQNQ